MKTLRDVKIALGMHDAKQYHNKEDFDKDNQTPTTLQGKLLVNTIEMTKAFGDYNEYLFRIDGNYIALQLKHQPWDLNELHPFNIKAHHLNAIQIIKRHLQESGITYEDATYDEFLKIIERSGLTEQQFYIAAIKSIAGDNNTTSSKTLVIISPVANREVDTILGYAK